ncbi:MAG: hypothetical protein ABIP12_04690 [Terriglobales bacterium]
MRKAMLFLANRVTAGMLCFLLLMAAWQFGIKPTYFRQALIAAEAAR